MGLWEVFSIGICLAFSFLFSGMEAGMLALNRLRIRQKMRAGDRSARVLLGFLNRHESFLWTILIGNTVMNFFLVSLSLFQLHAFFGFSPWLFAGTFVVLVFLLYALCDLLPKILFQAYPEKLCLTLAIPFHFINWALKPAVAAVSWLTRISLRWTGGSSGSERIFANREELRIMMRESGAGFSTEERSMIERVLDFQRLTVRQVTIPLEKTVMVDRSASMDTVLKLCRERSLTRLLVREQVGGKARTVGLFSLKSVLYSEDMDVHKTAGDYLRPALFLDGELHLEEGLRRMQRSGQRLAVVLVRGGQELGVVSLQDMLRALFGEVSL